MNTTVRDAANSQRDHTVIEVEANTTDLQTEPTLHPPREESPHSSIDLNIEPPFLDEQVLPSDELLQIQKTQVQMLADIKQSLQKVEPPKHWRKAFQENLKESIENHRNAFSNSAVLAIFLCALQATIVQIITDKDTGESPNSGAKVALAFAFVAIAWSLAAAATAVLTTTQCSTGPSKRNQLFSPQEVQGGYENINPDFYLTEFNPRSSPRYNIFAIYGMDNLQEAIESRLDWPYRIVAWTLAVSFLLIVISLAIHIVIVYSIALRAGVMIVGGIVLLVAGVICYRQISLARRQSSAKPSSTKVWDDVESLVMVEIKLHRCKQENASASKFRPVFDTLYHRATSHTDIMNRANVYNNYLNRNTDVAAKFSTIIHTYAFFSVYQLKGIPTVLQDVFKELHKLEIIYVFLLNYLPNSEKVLHNTSGQPLDVHWHITRNFMIRACEISQQVVAIYRKWLLTGSLKESEVFLRSEEGECKLAYTTLKNRALQVPDWGVFDKVKQEAKAFFDQLEKTGTIQESFLTEYLPVWGEFFKQVNREGNSGLSIASIGK